MGKHLGNLRIVVLAGLALVAHPHRETPRIHASETRQAPGNFIQLFYLLPGDAPDRRLDSNGKIARSFAAAQRWLALNTGGLRLRVRNAQGHLVLFHRSRRRSEDWLALGKHALYGIEEELRGVGWDTSKSALGVYFDGPNTDKCGDSVSPDNFNTGRIGVLYLSGAPCGSISLAGADGRPGYWEFLFLHEMVHALGFVSDCAPHYTTLGHVSDSPADLMYRGPLAWAPTAIDLNGDDYFNHSNPDCPNLANSPYLVAGPIPP